jgi:type I restriction enzyme S subunit
MSKYETYIETNVTWFKELPAHWKRKRIKDVTLTIAGGTPDTSKEEYWEGNIPWLPSGKVQNSVIYEEDVDTFITEEGLKNSATKMIPAPATLIALTGATCSNIGYLTFNACANQSVVGMPGSSKMLPKFLFYTLQSQKEQILLQQTGGAQGGISESDVKFLFVPVPTKYEQLTIANYLDDQTQKIDRLIANKKAQAEKLKELRQIEINNAVTKGLNPNAEMKESGIDWLGKIPKHWEKRKIATNFQIIGSGTTPDAGNEEYYDETGKYYFVNTGDLKDCEIYDCEKKITEEAFTKFTSLKLFPVNTLLIAMYGATIGKVGILKTEATTNQACCALANSYRFNIDYMFYFFIGIREDIIRLSYGGGQPNISQDTIKQLRIPCPPKDEQSQIVEHLKKRTTAIDQLIKNIEAQIEKLQELRKIKIYEAVTGKIKVSEP